MVTAGEFCNRDVVIARADESVVEIARRMRDHHVGSVVVVEERTDGRVPIGILTDRDIVVGLVAVEPSYVERAVVQDLLGRKLSAAREEENLWEVVARMRSQGVRRLPVVDRAGVLQGIIAFDDLVAYVAEEISGLSVLLQHEQHNEQAARPALAKKD